MFCETAKLRLPRLDRGLRTAQARDVDRRAYEVHRPALDEGRAARGGDVARDAVGAPEHAIFQGVAAISGGIDAGGDRVPDAGQVLGMDPGLEHVHVDLDL